MPRSALALSRHQDRPYTLDYIRAAFTDFIYNDDAMLHYSIASANALFYPLAMILFAYGLKGYRASMAEAGDWKID